MILHIFDGNYGRKGTIKIGSFICLKCGNCGLGLAIDNSENEYNAGTICKKCIEEGFAIYQGFLARGLK